MAFPHAAMLLGAGALLMASCSRQAGPAAALPSDAADGLYSPSRLSPPPLLREFRGAWVASVQNVDWPSRTGLSTEAQKTELIDLLDRAVALKLNAIVLQVRPACDALYASPFEPWSAYLTGKMGQAPEPAYDPLEFAVSEAHRRGLELHAWFNPFRALASVKEEASGGHISKVRPDLVLQYGKALWLDPGLPEVRDYSIKVITDVVRRYDVDAVHIDDYFYPYPFPTKGKPQDFPDDASWKAYQESGGRLARSDWRRENVSGFVERLYSAIKTEKRWVRFGISPFGIWRPGKVENIRGLDAYDELYADSRKWLENGWLDYLAPQLYWDIGATHQSYPALLGWWAGCNTMHRHLWPGLDAARVGQSRPAIEIANQIRLTRSTPGAQGNILWSMTSLLHNPDAVSDLLSREIYPTSALVPASPWLGRVAFEKPEIAARSGRVSWAIHSSQSPRFWTLQTRTDGEWSTRVLPASQTTELFDPANPPDIIALTAIDHCGNASEPAVLERRSDPKRTFALDFLASGSGPATRTRLLP